MKTLSLLPFLFLSHISSGESLIGQWESCDVINPSRHLEYQVQFLPNGIMIEIEFVRDQSITPCEGKRLFALLKVSKFQSINNRLETILYTADVFSYDDASTRQFSNGYECGVEKWETRKEVNCLGKTFIGTPFNKWNRELYLFEVKGERLYVTEEDGTRMVFDKGTGLK